MIQAKPKFIWFQLVEQRRLKTHIWNVINLRWGTRLGGVSWYSGWRQYCFFPENDCVFSAGCLKDIADFIEEQMQERKIAVLSEENE